MPLSFTGYQVLALFLIFCLLVPLKAKILKLIYSDCYKEIVLKVLMKYELSWVYVQIYKFNLENIKVIIYVKINDKYKITKKDNIMKIS